MNFFLYISHFPILATCSTYLILFGLIAPKIMFKIEPIGQCFPTRIPQNTVEGFTRNSGLNKNVKKPRKIPNIPRNIAGIVSGNWQFWTNLLGLQTATLCLVITGSGFLGYGKLFQGLLHWKSAWRHCCTL
jgi:hypothetical protein